MHMLNIKLAYSMFCQHQNHRGQHSGSVVVFLVLYVDDILLIRNNIPLFQEVKEWLLGKFSMKDLEEVTSILGIKSIRIDRKGCLDYPNPHT